MVTIPLAFIEVAVLGVTIAMLALAAVLRTVRSGDKKFEETERYLKIIRYLMIIGIGFGIIVLLASAELIENTDSWLMIMMLFVFGLTTGMAGILLSRAPELALVSVSAPNPEVENKFYKLYQVLIVSIVTFWIFGVVLTQFNRLQEALVMFSFLLTLSVVLAIHILNLYKYISRPQTIEESVE